MIVPELAAARLDGINMNPLDFLAAELRITKLNDRLLQEIRVSPPTSVQIIVVNDLLIHGLPVAGDAGHRVSLCRRGRMILRKTTYRGTSILYGLLSPSN